MDSSLLSLGMTPKLMWTPSRQSCLGRPLPGLAKPSSEPPCSQALPSLSPFSGFTPTLQSKALTISPAPSSSF